MASRGAVLETLIKGRLVQVLEGFAPRLQLLHYSRLFIDVIKWESIRGMAERCKLQDERMHLRAFTDTVLIREQRTSQAWPKTPTSSVG